MRFRNADISFRASLPTSFDGATIDKILSFVFWNGSRSTISSVIASVLTRVITLSILLRIIFSPSPGIVPPSGDSSDIFSSTSNDSASQSRLSSRLFGFNCSFCASNLALSCLSERSSSPSDAAEEVRENFSKSSYIISPVAIPSSISLAVLPKNLSIDLPILGIAAPSAPPNAAPPPA